MKISGRIGINIVASWCRSVVEIHTSPELRVGHFAAASLMLLYTPLFISALYESPATMIVFTRMIAASFFVVILQTTASAQTMTNLFQFSEASDSEKWQIVNDGVMGGRSSSQASIVKLDSVDNVETGNGVMRFAGNLSLENNGGFASVRSRPNSSLGLDPGETIILRVKGDGRRYTFNLYTPDRRTAFSYQLPFDTTAGQWTEVKLPVDKFVAHSFGRPIPSMKLTPNQVQSVGILLGDKTPGPFEILIDWIQVESSAGNNQ